MINKIKKEMPFILASLGLLLPFLWIYLIFPFLTNIGRISLLVTGLIAQGLYFYSYATLDKRINNKEGNNSDSINT